MRAISFTFVLAVQFLCVASAHAWSEEDARIGAQNHPKFLAQQGGMIEDRALLDYVDRIGQRIVAQTPLARERWTFSVTDTPVVNAFAAPGGYVYVTRGLLGLANSEAELAAVLGHEAGHLVAQHHAKRQKRGKDASIGVLVGTLLGGVIGGKDGLKKGIELSTTVVRGYVGQFSQAQEFESDQLGTTYLARAGYSPFGQAEILAGLGAKRAFEAKKSGQSYNPNRVDFFATHPATEDRVRRARRLAEEINGAPRFDGEEVYLSAIDGIVYGDTAAQGFVRGRSFLHPVIGFGYEVPEGFTITNSARRVIAKGPGGSTFNLDGGGTARGTLKGYLTGTWVPKIAEELPVGTLSDVITYEAGGVSSAHAILPIKRAGEMWNAHLTLIKHRGRFIRLTGVAKVSDRKMLDAFDAAARSFRALKDKEIQKLKPLRLRSYRVQPGDTVAWLALASPAQPEREALFRTLNGMAEGDALVPGELVKVVVE